MLPLQKFSVAGYEKRRLFQGRRLRCERILFDVFNQEFTRRGCFGVFNHIRHFFDNRSGGNHGFYLFDCRTGNHSFNFFDRRAGYDRFDLRSRHDFGVADNLLIDDRLFFISDG